MTTPETGTYFDAVPGHVSVGEDFKRDEAPPRVVIGTDKSLTWPELVSIERLSRAPAPSSGTSPSAPTATAPSATELGTSISEAITALGRLGETLKAADAGAKEATPAAPTPAAPTTAAPAGAAASDGTTPLDGATTPGSTAPTPDEADT